MNEYLHRTYYGNTVLEYLYVVGSIILVWIVLRLTKRFMIAGLKNLAGRTDGKWDDVMVSSFEKFALPFIYLMINIGIIRQLNLSEKVNNVLSVALTVITIFYCVRLVNHVIHLSIKLYMESKNEGDARLKQLTGVLIVIKVITWMIGFLFFLDNIGFEITTVITGLGVGGIAVALAAQNILSDVFSYFVIFFDKPFEIGDFIVVQDKAGTVEKIGIKTSHVRSISGEQLIMPNAELVKSVIQNFKRLERRRVVFSVGITMQTKLDKVKLVPGIIKSIIESKEKAQFDRSHLKEVGDFSYNYETVYFSLSPEYGVMMGIQESILQDYLAAFEQHGIELAYPTQTLLLENTGEKTKISASAGVGRSDDFGKND